MRLGREITAEDRAGGHMVCVINETFAKRFFDGRNPIGLHVTQMYANQRKMYQVVGVVQDSRQNRIRGEIEHRFYVPATQPAAEHQRGHVRDSSGGQRRGGDGRACARPCSRRSRACGSPRRAR